MNKIKAWWILAMLPAVACWQAPLVEKDLIENKAYLTNTSYRNTTPIQNNKNHILILSGYMNGEYWLYPVSRESNDSVKQPFYYRIAEND